MLLRKHAVKLEFTSCATKNNSQTPTFDTATDIITDLLHRSMLYSLPRFCLVHTVDSCANEGRFSCDKVII